MANQRFVKQLWISSGIIVVSIAIAAAGIFYYTGDLSTKASAIVSDRGKVQQNAAALGNLAVLQQESAQAVQYQTAMNELLPDQYGLVTFEQWLAQLGQRYNVTTNATFQNSPTSPQGTIPGTAGFSFSAEGSPANLTSFLGEMVSQSSGFLLNVSSFDFTSDGTNAKITGQGVVFFR